MNRFAATIGVLLLSISAAMADGYTKWTTDTKAKTHTCEYVYENKSKGNSSQTVVVYYGDKDRQGWAYYYNAKKEPWARCAIPGNPNYNAKAMTWEALKPDATGYAPFTDKQGQPEPAGYCPAAKDGKKPIMNLPLPPK